MTQSKKCPRCGRETPANAPEGLCPSCLMKVNFDEGTGLSAQESTSRPPPMALEQVGKLFPELEILGFLGAGGMGAVYKARQPVLEREVALKILDRRGDDPDFVERFTREAKTLARLNHPNIVSVFEFGERDGVLFLIMELVDGATLRDLLREGRMKPEQALTIVPPICEALEFAHGKGIVHRDIKPENLLIDKEGRVKVADFGIARLAGEVQSTNLTAEGQIVGTTDYMAPEQRERPTEVDHRADIYALGVVFYEMLTGELPVGHFLRPSGKVDVDVRLDEVVLKALAREPERRYQHASELRTGVETARGGLPPSEERIEMSGKPPWRLVAVALLFIVIGVMSVWEMGRDWGWLIYGDSGITHVVLDMTALALPVGIGLLRFRPWWRKAGMIGLVVVFVLLLIALVLMGVVLAQNGAKASGFDGAAFLSACWVCLAGILVALVALGWMFLVLRGRGVRNLFRRRGFCLPWLEWTVSAGLFVTALVTAGWWGHASRSNAEQRASFGPVIERVLSPGHPETGLLNLASGNFVSAHSEMGSVWEWDDPEFGAWLKDIPGADLVATIYEGEARLATPPSTELRWIPGEHWLRPSITEGTRTTLKLTPWVKGAGFSDTTVSIFFPKTPEPDAAETAVQVWHREGLPATYTFATVEGITGMLQVVEYSRDPRGVRIRYAVRDPDWESVHDGR